MLVGIILGVVLFGMTLLLVTFGYKNIEDEREREAEALARRRERHPAPRFFSPVFVTESAGRCRDATATPMSSAELDSLVADVDRYLRLEQFIAERFLDQPSIGSLHRQTHRASWSGRTTPRRSFDTGNGSGHADPDAVVGNLERFLRRENFLAQLFAVQPSVDNLHRSNERAVWTN